MRDWVVPLSDVRFDEADVEVVADTYRRGWLSQGPQVAAFEQDVAAYVGAREAIAVANGTAALQLIASATRLGPGDEVVLPSLTFAATAAAVVHPGARPVFADIHADGRPWLSPSSVEEKLTQRTRAVIAVSYSGHPGDVDELRALTRERGLILIEDAAHALGSRSGERHVGTIGDAGAYSFFANKNLPLGEGGMVVTDDPELAARARLLRSHGLTSDTWARHRGDAPGYDVLEPGFNFRLDEARAALGSRLLGRLDSENRRRGELARAYEEALSEIEGVSPAIALDEAAAASAWHLYPIVLDEALDRGEFRERLAADRVQTSVHYPPLHLTRAYGGDRTPALPATEAYASRTVTLPMFAGMEPQQQRIVIRSISQAAKLCVQPS